MQLLVGTRTAGDINLIAQILMLVALWIGFYFARTKQIPKHRNVQTTVVLANLFFIAFIMITSFYSFIILGGTTSGTVATLMMIHGLLGLVAELIGIYLILRMRTQLIPPRFRVRNFKLVMRTLLGLWTVIVVLGLGIYYFRYLAPKASAITSPIARLQRAVDDIAIHTDEMQAAAKRGNLATTKRHAEHVVNLIEGKTGADYGDLDKDGDVEDPGDGTGALNILHQVRDDAASAGGNSAQVTAIADQIQNVMIKIIADAKAVAQASDLSAVAAPNLEAVNLANQISTGTNNSVPQIAQLLNASTALPTVAVVENAPSAPNTVTVNIKNFEFAPKTLTIEKGTTVVFVNLDNTKHTATADSGTFKSPDLGASDKFTFTFDTPGTYPYYCEFHGDKGGVDMSGTIIVQ